MEIETKRHNKIIKILFELSKDYKPYGKVYADHVSKDYKKIVIHSNNKRAKPIAYPFQPDLWCKYKRTNKIDIFEVWDSQSEDACVEDILFSALTPNIDALYIVCFKKDKYKLALELVEVILSSLHSEEGELLLDPSHIKKNIVLIPEEMVNDEDKIKKFLSTELRF